MEDGVYSHGDYVYRVRDTTVEVLVRRDKKWQYEIDEDPGLRPEHHMRPSEALERFGQLGCCVDCLRSIEHPESLRRGYGPVCAIRNGWPYDTNAD